MRETFISINLHVIGGCRSIFPQAQVSRNKVAVIIQPIESNYFMEKIINMFWTPLENKGIAGADYNLPIMRGYEDRVYAKAFSKSAMLSSNNLN